MMTGWGLYIFPVIGVAWAASAEMGSYLLLPILMAFTLRKSTATAAIAVLAAFVAIYAVSISNRGSGGPLDVVNGNSLYPMLPAVCGFALGLAIFRFSDLVDRLSATVQDILVVALPLAIIVVGAADASDRLMYLLFIPLVAVLSRDGRMAQLLFGNRLVYRLGIISYSIYLIHPLFVSFVVRSWRHFGQTDGNYIVCSLVAFAIIWVLAEVSYRLVEMPGRRAVLNLFSPKRQAASAV
jgi:peptidoglycan/LPS O-acetylase OafA/YrhL